MDPVTHLLATATLVGRGRVELSAGVLPDLPWYLLYPAWLLYQSKSRAERATVWPMPPDRIRMAHYATHSLLSLGALYAVARLFRRRPNRWCLPWLLHILIDVPSHSRERMAPRLLWPLSDWAFDGFPWADWLSRQVQAIAIRRHAGFPRARP